MDRCRPFHYPIRRSVARLRLMAASQLQALSTEMSHFITVNVSTANFCLVFLSCRLNLYLVDRPAQPSFVVPFRRDTDFVDRDDLLSRVDERCSQPAGRAALIGLGGVGKSQLAIEYTYRTQERSPDTSVFWVHASNATRFEQGYRDIAGAVKIAGREDLKADIFKLVHDWLRGCEGKWLLVLDNVDSTDLLSEVGDAGQRGQGTGVDCEPGQPMSAYLPQSSNGSILVTSRSQAVALTLVEEKDIIAVQPMVPVHALSLFEKKLGPLGQGDDTMELAAALEFMPLAIVQAAAYISQRAPRCSVQRYLEDFQKSDRKKTSLLNYEGGHLQRDWQAQNSIIITWQISFEHIRRTRPSAADLLSLMSFFDRQGIPEALVRNRGEIGNNYGNQEERDNYDDREKKENNKDNEDNEDSASGCSEDDRFEQDVQILRDYSFISLKMDKNFEMHALVQVATRRWLKTYGQFEHFKQHCVHNLAARFPTGDYENWTTCRALFPHVKATIAQRPRAEASLREWASLLYNAASYAWGKGSMTEAVDLSEIAIEVRKKVLGQEHQETLGSMNLASLIYVMGGRWREAEELQLQVRETSRKTLGKEHPNTLTSIESLAITYWNQGRWKEAEELEVQVMETRKRVQGEEHPCTLNSVGNLASIYRSQGFWKQADELDIKVLEVSQRVLSKDHPNTLTSMANLASTYCDQRRWKEAEELFIQVKEMRQKVLGEEHPDTLFSMANLASVYWYQGRWKETEELKVQVKEIRQRVLGEEHPDTLFSVNDIALIWKYQGEDEKAIALMEECVRKRKQVLGQDHPFTKESEDTLSWWRMEGLHSASQGKHINSTAAGESRAAEMIPQLSSRE